MLAAKLDTHCSPDCKHIRCRSSSADVFPAHPSRPPGVRRSERNKEERVFIVPARFYGGASLTRHPCQYASRPRSIEGTSGDLPHLTPMWADGGPVRALRLAAIAPAPVLSINCV